MSAIESSGFYVIGGTLRPDAPSYVVRKADQELFEGLTEYDPDRIHHARIGADEVAKVTADLLGQTRGQRLAIPVMHPGRADVIGAGALILRTIVHRSGLGAVVASEHDILDGIAYSVG